MKKILMILSLTSFAMVSQAGWKTKEKEQHEVQVLSRKVAESRENLMAENPDLNSFFEQAFAYIIFPSVKKAATGIGGALGKGLVYQGGQLVGRVKLRQLSIGLQLGGQAYTEVVFFENEAAYNRLLEGKIELGAQASAIAIHKGISRDGIYHDGLAVFTLTRTGLMYEASIGGQKFKFMALP